MGTQKTIKIDISVHTALASIGQKTETFNEIIQRLIRIHNAIPETMSKVDVILGVARASCVGNIEATENLKTLRYKIDELLRD